MHVGFDQIDTQSESSPRRHAKKKLPSICISRYSNIELYVYESGVREMLLFPMQVKARLKDIEADNMTISTVRNSP